MKIGQLSQKYNLSHRQIRYYEAMGLLSASRDTSSNYRIYDEKAVANLELVSLLKPLGFSLKDIKAMIDGGSSSFLETAFKSKKRETLLEFNAIQNKLQVLNAIDGILSTKGAEYLSLREILKEQIYLNGTMERMVPMENERILCEFGIHLVPVVTENNQELLQAFKKMKAEKGVGEIIARFRDVAQMDDYSVQLMVDGNLVFKKKYNTIDTGQIRQEWLEVIEGQLDIIPAS